MGLCHNTKRTLAHGLARSRAGIAKAQHRRLGDSWAWLGELVRCAHDGWRAPKVLSDQGQLAAAVCCYCYNFVGM